ncbi:hypothetical protein CK203_047742 [Vitis vinifera]|uniref:Uncharacterized protein n=1 Tax=Vitis vinifera TaxID=29760 RepID=A0A438H161_VITVI|nr:hypothetical protein CK203_047742 [Vitis vinifera]
MSYSHQVPGVYPPPPSMAYPSSGPYVAPPPVGYPVKDAHPNPQNPPSVVLSAVLTAVIAAVRAAFASKDIDTECFYT